MQNLTYEEQSIIKMYDFETKEELVEKLNIALEEIEEQEMKELVKNLIFKIAEKPLEEIREAKNIFE